MITLENGNRRAERDGNFLVFLKLTGNVRRSKRVVWSWYCPSERAAKRLAEAWVYRADLPRCKANHVSHAKFLRSSAARNASCDAGSRTLKLALAFA
jgi:hypothetical protein